MSQSQLALQKILMVGPLPARGTYNGGIAVLLSQIRERWSLPCTVTWYNTNTVARDYSATNRLNLTNMRRFLRHAFDLMRLVRRERPDIVHFHTSRHLALLKDLVLVAILRGFGHPRIVGHIHHASYSTLLVGSATWGRILQLKLLLAAFDRVCFMSKNIEQILAGRFTGEALKAFSRKARVLYNFTLPPEPRTPPMQAADRPILFFIGNVGPAKGVYDLVECAGRLRHQGFQFELVLAGPFDSPAEGARLNARIRDCELGGWVRMTGPVSGPHKSALFESADIFVLPSYAEGVPLSILEAMSYSLPVVATAVGGVPEVLTEGKTGLLVEPGDIEGLRAALGRLLVCPGLRKQLGTAGRNRVEQHHCPEAFFRGLGTIYEELTSRPARIAQTWPSCRWGL